MIGWYVHHHGHGHLHRALAVARHLDEPVTGLSTLEAPDGWPGEWVRLPPDEVAGPVDPTAGGVLHWAPLREPAIRSRAAGISAWIEAARPDALVVDVSVEAALLARLHGVPVVTVAMPGERGDAPHRAAYDVSAAVLAPWPPKAGGMLGRGGLYHVGMISRFGPGDPALPVEPRTVVALLGSGGDDLPAGWFERARERTPQWRWTVLGGSGGAWVDDPWAALCSAEVAVTHAGQNALAEVAAARRPTVVLPMSRPHREQEVAAHALLEADAPVRVVGPTEEVAWPAVLEEVAGLDGSRWQAWCDGHGAERAAAVVRAVARGEGPAR